MVSLLQPVNNCLEKNVIDLNLVTIRGLGDFVAIKKKKKEEDNENDDKEKCGNLSLLPNISLLLLLSK
jgi:hypothetical protein